MHALVRLALALHIGALLAGCGQPLASTPAEAAQAPTASTAAIAAPARTATPETPPPNGTALPADTAATWDYTGAGPPEIVLPAGATYVYAGEHADGWCRITLADGARPWVPCVVIGVAPTDAAAPPVSCASFLFADNDNYYYTGCGATHAERRAAAAARATAAALQHGSP
jgi:hypothetical protein